MAEVRFVLNPQQLQKLLAGPDGPVGQDLVQRCNRVLNAARSTCPVDTGNLRGSLTTEIAKQADDLVGRVGSNVPYAVYVEAATGFLQSALGAASG